MSDLSLAFSFGHVPYREFRDRSFNTYMLHKERLQESSPITQLLPALAALQDTLPPSSLQGSESGAPHLDAQVEQVGVQPTPNVADNQETYTQLIFFHIMAS